MADVKMIRGNNITETSASIEDGQLLFDISNAQISIDKEENRTIIANYTEVVSAIEKAEGESEYSNTQVPSEKAVVGFVENKIQNELENKLPVSEIKQTIFNNGVISDNQNDAVVYKLQILARADGTATDDEIASWENKGIITLVYEQ